VLPTFTWTGDGQTDSYLIEVATDIGFSNVVLSATTTLETYTAGTALAANTTHYWRVTARNSCESATPSGVFVFSTGSTAPTAVTLGALEAGSDVPVWVVALSGITLAAATLALKRRRL
jgi:hypothetical protein